VVDWLTNIPPRYGWTLLLLAVVFAVYRMGVGMLRSFSDDRRLATPFLILRRVMRWTAILVAVLAGLQTLGVLEAAWAAEEAAGCDESIWEKFEIW
jgi:hypothetical protein